MTVRKLEDNAKQILVQLEDGSTWRAAQEPDGLYLIEQLTSPSSPATSSTPEGEGAPEGSEEDDTESASEATPEPVESEMEEESEAKPEPTTDPYKDMFEGESKGSAGLEGMLKKLKSVTGMPDSLKDKLKDPAFRARLSSVMLDNKYDRRIRGRTRGKLDMGRLPKVPLMQRNVFMKKQARKGKAYNVVLLVDESGSMGHDAAEAAADATLFLMSMLDGLNINTAVIGFNRAVMIHKPWDKKGDYDLIYKQIVNHYEDPWSGVSDGGDNNDYDAMHFGLEYFKKAPEGENIFIMLSDGSPATYGATRFVDENGKKILFTPHKHLNSGQKDQKSNVNHLSESYKNIHQFGIGIFEGGWQIPDHEIIHSLDDLKPAIIKSLRKGIKRG